MNSKIIEKIIEEDYWRKDFWGRIRIQPTIHPTGEPTGSVLGRDRGESCVVNECLTSLIGDKQRQLHTTVGLLKTEVECNRVVDDI